MPRLFSHAEYADMIFVYGFCNGSAPAAVEEYRRRYPGRVVPNRKVFCRIFNNLRVKGTLPSAQVSSERQPVRVAETENILQAVQRSPTTSTRRISAQLNIPKSTVWRTINAHGLYPFHQQKVQHLRPGDHPRRLQFCQWVNLNHQSIPFILFSDEANFTRNGINNTRNSHVWSEENPHATVESNFQQRFSVNVWCGMIDNQLIGPYILEHRVTGGNYLKFLNNEFIAVLENFPLAKRTEMYFQHDGAPIHFTNEVKQFLDEKFPDKWIGRGGPVEWPPRSPDLTPLDYCLWGWMKSEVYKQKVDTRDELIVRILNTAAIIKERQDIIMAATENLRTRVEKCIDVNGGIFEPLL